MTTYKNLLGRVRLSRLSDEALVERGRQGDKAAFEEFYRRHRASVIGFCLLRLRDRQAAEETTQDIFLKAYTAQGKPLADARAWLFTIARNAVIDSARRARSRAPEQGLALDELASVEDSSLPAAFSALEVPSNVFLALRRLKARERKALIMREFQDRSSMEIGEKLQLSPATVDVLLNRARGSFGVAYEQVCRLPFACRQATEFIYRDMGSGLSDHKRTSMKEHLERCPRCSMEYRIAHSPKMVGGLVAMPWVQSVMELVARTPLVTMRPLAQTAVGVAVAVAVIGPVTHGARDVRPVVEYESQLEEITHTSDKTPPARDPEDSLRSAGQTDRKAEPQHVARLLDDHPKAMDTQHQSVEEAHVAGSPSPEGESGHLKSGPDPAGATPHDSSTRPTLSNTGDGHNAEAGHE